MRNASLNSVINVILARYVSYYRRAEQVGTVTVPSSSFHFYLEKVDEGEHTEMLRQAMSEIVPLIFHELNTPITLETVIRYLYEDIGVNSGAFNSVILYKDADRYPCVLMRHKHGVKWSRIAGTAASQHMEQLLRCRTEINSVGPTSVMIRFLDKSLY